MSSPNAPVESRTRLSEDEIKGAAKKVLRAARDLPEPERVELVEEPIAELDGSDEDVDTAWATEIGRRTREIDEGKVKPLSWATVRRRIAPQAVKAARLVFHPDAVDEYVDAARWYGERSAKVHDSFTAETERALRLIVAFPNRWPRYGRRHRRVLVRRFPYSSGVPGEGRPTATTRAVVHTSPMGPHGA